MSDLITIGFTDARLIEFCQPEITALVRKMAEFQKPASAKPDDDGWIPWAGGECPVPPKTRVEVRWSNHGIASEFNIGPADMWLWDNPRSLPHIIAYRLSKPEAK